jgi:hypothetical protein
VEVANVTERLAKLAKEAETLLAPIEGVTSAPPVVYHYTSLDALCAIIKTQTLWCSNTKYSSDPSEAIHGQSIIDELLQERLSRRTYDVIHGFLVALGYYAASFSSEGDLLPQWRAYCSNGRGVALGISSAALHATPGLLFGRVEYDEQCQRHLVNSLLDIYGPEIVGNESVDDDACHQFRRNLAANLACLKGMFKAAAYFSEAEYRLFDVLFEDESDRLCFRTAGASLVPYITADLHGSAISDATLPFQEIIVGPCLDPDAATAIELLLRRQKFTGVKVRRSSVHMRTA